MTWRFTEILAVVYLQCVVASTFEFQDQQDDQDDGNQGSGHDADNHGRIFGCFRTDPVSNAFVSL